MKIVKIVRNCVTNKKLRLYTQNIVLYVESLKECLSCKKISLRLQYDKDTQIKYNKVNGLNVVHPALQLNLNTQ